MLDAQQLDAQHADDGRARCAAILADVLRNSLARCSVFVATLTLAGCASAPLAADAGQDAAAPTDARVTDASLDEGTVDADGGAHVDLGVVPPADAGSACPPRPLQGLFVWNDDLVETRDEILALAEARGVTEIYLHANLFYAGDRDESALAAWIEAAGARCIAVELLFGNADWLLPAGRAEATSRTAWAVAFADAHPGARPSGVHWDLEPQQLAAWHADVTTQPGFVSDLVDTLEVLTPVAEAGGLPLSIDLGFFFDGIDVTRGGVTRPGSQWVTDAVSRVVLMDYRDTALSTGHGGLISLAEAEVVYASAVGVPIVLAVETTPQDPTYVSFAEEGFAAMTAELAVVRAHFASASAFAGTALHDRDGVAALAP